MREMAFAELNLTPRTRGRAASPLAIEVTGELRPADLALLASERGIVAPTIVRLRERHHHLARVLAGGANNSEASLITGYDPSRISILRSDPTFQALMADYRSIEDGLLADFVDRATTLGMTAMSNLQDKLEEGSTSDSMELEIAKFAADRTGHAPVQKSVSLSANVELGSRLNAARKRMQAAQAVLAEVIQVRGDEAASGSVEVL